MIEAAMLIMLGFLLASLLALLLAAPVWRRAVRLTRRRLEASMPMSLSDIQAARDQLRAEFAIRLRRLEMALDREREKAARHLVERNKNQVKIAELEREMKALRTALDERGSASTVLEQTVKRKMPQLTAQLERAREIIAQRDRDLARLSTAYENEREAVAIAKRAADRYAEEIAGLREKLESGGGALVNVLRKGADEDGVLAETNVKLEVELSRAREEIARLQDLEQQENALLRQEMQELSRRLTGAVGEAEDKAKKKKEEKAEEKKKPAAKADAKKDSKPAEKAADRPARKRKPARKSKKPASGTAAAPRRTLTSRLRRISETENA